MLLINKIYFIRTYLNNLNFIFLIKIFKKLKYNNNLKNN